MMMTTTRMMLRMVFSEMSEERDFVAGKRVPLVLLKMDNRRMAVERYLRTMSYGRPTSDAVSWIRSVAPYSAGFRTYVDEVGTPKKIAASHR